MTIAGASMGEGIGIEAGRGAGNEACISTAVAVGREEGPRVVGLGAVCWDGPQPWQ